MAEYRLYTDSGGNVVCSARYAPKGQQAHTFMLVADNKEEARKSVIYLRGAVDSCRPRGRMSQDALQELTLAKEGVAK